MRTEGEGGYCKPGREASPEPDHTCLTLILDCQPPELQGYKCLWFKPRSFWHFVIVA